MVSTPLHVFRQEFASAKTPLRIVSRISFHENEKVAEIKRILQKYKPRRVGNFTVYFADLKEPSLVADGGVVLGKVVILEREKFGRIPKKFLSFVLRHELREELLMIAGYSERARKGGSSVHRIALRKELRDLLRKGVLKEYLLMLKRVLPLAYAERIRKWRIDEKTLLSATVNRKNF